MKLVIKSVYANEPVSTVTQPTNRMVVIDCSGSMSSELSKLRTHLKNKLPTMVLPDDTLTVIWFSGKSQCGVLFERIQISTLQDVQMLNAAIDRYITPIGMTSFQEPLEEVLKVINSADGQYTMSFMTDGYSNSGGSKEDILELCSVMSDKLTSAAFVEYGFYADHTMLMDMAENIGGQVVLASNFASYQESLDTSLKSASTSSKKIKIKNIESDFVVGNNSTGFVIARPDAIGTVTLPADTESYSYLDGDGGMSVITSDEPTNLKRAAFMVSALIMRGQADIALEVAATLGDKLLYKSVENSFSKQDYANTVQVANKIGSGKTSLYSAGKDMNMIPDENAYNVLNLLMDLASRPGNQLHISHPEFSYSPIGSKRETDVDEEGFKPVFTNKDGEIKADISALKFDEDRPNISILTRRSGTVSLPDNEFGFGNSIDSFIWRNYAIVKDGIVNLEKLPVILTKSTYDHFKTLSVVSEPFQVGKTFVIDTKLYPIINRAMATPSTAAEAFQLAFELYKLRSKQKYIASKVEKPEVGSKFTELYGVDGAAFLKSYGVSEGGFSPKTTKGEKVDSYIAKVLELKLSSLSSIPKIADVEKAIADKKTLTPSQKVMEMMIAECATVTDFEEELISVKSQIRSLMDRIVQIKFGIIIGKRWFVDMASLDDNTLEIDFSLGKVTKCQACLSDEEI